MQGDRVSGARKPATLVTGLVVQVPLFVEPERQIRVDTRTGEYITRANVMTEPPGGSRGRREARERAVHSLYEAEQRDCDAPDDPRRPGARRPIRYTATLVAGVEPTPGRDRRADRAVSPRAGRSSGCRRWTGRCSESRIYELGHEPEVPDGGRAQRGGRAGQQLLDRRLGPVRQRRAGRGRRERARDPRRLIASGSTPWYRRRRPLTGVP